MWRSGCLRVVWVVFLFGGACGSSYAVLGAIEAQFALLRGMLLPLYALERASGVASSACFRLSIR